MGINKLIRDLLTSRFSYYLLIYIFSASLLNLNNIVEKLLPSIATFNFSGTQNINSWSATKVLKAGEYFISIGQVEGTCVLKHNGISIASNEAGSANAQSSLVMSANISVTGSFASTIELLCKKTLGTPMRLRNQPYLADYRQGMFIHLLRLFTSFLLPSIAVLFIFLFFLFISHEQSFKIPREATISAILTSLYLMSLSTVGYLFLEMKTALLIHFSLKSIFILGIMSWLIPNKKGVKTIGVITVLAVGLFAYSYFYSYDLFFKSYLLYYNLIPLIGIYGFLNANSWTLKGIFNSTSAPAFVPFILFTIIDCFMIDSGNGGYFSTATTLCIYGISIFSFLSIEKSKSLARKVVSIITSKQLEYSSTEESLKQMAMIFAECLKVKNWSVYLDSFLLGSMPKSGLELRRIASSKNDSQNFGSVIDLEDTSRYGSIMKEALSIGEPIVRSKRSETVSFVILPISNVCCINLRNIERKYYDEAFLKVFFNECFQQIKSIALSAVKFESAASLSTTVIREELGVGTHELDFGAIFADATGYTQNVNASSKFVEFFEREYVPSLLRNLGKRVVLKDLFGDELFLVILSDGNDENSANVSTKTLNCVFLIRDFSLGVGAELCRSAGFQPIEFKVGANSGHGKFIISSTSVALSGPIIEAKRCQSRARSSEPFISRELFMQVHSENESLLVQETYAAKKEILTGYRIPKKVVQKSA